MIEELTKEQEKKLSAYRDKWLKIGLSTDDFTFETAKKISDFYYEKIAKKKKVPIVILDSPYSAWLAVCMLTNFSSTQVKDQVRNQVENQVRDQVENQVRSQVWDQVENQVRDQVWNQVENQVRSQVWDQVRVQVRVQVWSQVENQVRSQVWDQVESQVENQVRETGLMPFILPYLYGSFDASYFSFYNYMEEVFGFNFGEKWDWYKNTSQIGLFYPLENICVISRKPVEINLKEGRLHADGKPALQYADGFSIWALNGVRVPQYLAETPASNLDIEFFKKEQNADVKAEFIRKYGIERMVSMGKQIDIWENHESTNNFEWYKKSEYKLIDMSPIFSTYNYLPYLYMKNQTVPGIYHLECCYDPNSKKQPKTILEGLKVRLNGIDPETLEITAIA